MARKLTAIPDLADPGPCPPGPGFMHSKYNLSLREAVVRHTVFLEWDKDDYSLFVEPTDVAPYSCEWAYDVQVIEGGHSPYGYYLVLEIPLTLILQGTAQKQVKALLRYIDERIVWEHQRDWKHEKEHYDSIQAARKAINKRKPRALT